MVGRSGEGVEGSKAYLFTYIAHAVHINKGTINDHPLDHYRPSRRFTFIPVLR